MSWSWWFFTKLNQNYKVIDSFVHSEFIQSPKYNFDGDLSFNWLPIIVFEKVVGWGDDKGTSARNKCEFCVLEIYNFWPELWNMWEQSIIGWIIV